MSTYVICLHCQDFSINVLASVTLDVSRDYIDWKMDCIIHIRTILQTTSSLHLLYMHCKRSLCYVCLDDSKHHLDYLQEYPTSTYHSAVVKIKLSRFAYSYLLDSQNMQLLSTSLFPGFFKLGQG